MKDVELNLPQKKAKKFETIVEYQAMLLLLSQVYCSSVHACNIQIAYALTSGMYTDEVSEHTVKTEPK